MTNAKVMLFRIVLAGAVAGMVLMFGGPAAVHSGGFTTTASARIGRPLTPMSYAALRGGRPEEPLGMVLRLVTAPPHMGDGVSKRLMHTGEFTPVAIRVVVRWTERDRPNNH